ncbi:MAG: AbrB/MazE/SpoVT family DNA-binding domain-containing protein [Nanoarchaeota archaeon]
MAKIIEIGTISSRGQIAIPAKIRRKLVLDEGERIVFALEENTLVIKKFDEEKTWKEITAPLRESMKKTRFSESDAVDIIHRFRKSKKK